ncbi:hypothetical protein Tco_0960487 [Tanacetum coccineum]
MIYLVYFDQPRPPERCFLSRTEIGEDLFSYDSPLCLEFEKYNHLNNINENNEDTFDYDDIVQEPITRRKRKTMMAKPGMITWRLHSCKPVRVIGNDTCRFWPTCDPNLKDCNGVDLIYGMDEYSVPKHWYCYCNNQRRDVKGKEMLFSDFLLIRYGNNKIDDTTKERKYDKWFAQNNKHLSYSHGSTSKPYPRNYAIARGEVTNLGHQENPTLSTNSYFPNFS